MPRVTPQARPDELLDDPARRDAYVAGIFDLIAPRYDRFTRWFSYGMDAAWKREIRGVIASELRAAGAPDPVVVDLATGTGDLALGAHQLAPRGIVVGLDVSMPMLARAARRARQESAGSAHEPSGLHFAGADMMRLPLRDGSARLVTAGYGVRNAPRLDGALDEIVRVLAPGGTLVTLDFFLPANPVWRRLFLGYLAVAGWIYGALWHGRPDAYVYIPRSIRRFGTAAAYERALRERGLRMLESRSRLFGGVMIHVARKPA
ncbi:MAG TPA: class I SAM-dependent methyltransferase [Gemmatimonadaceae bacterium]|nr:class I SAM-dependent methyltransferase [Gemmatimonadaceae bacterium]